MTDYADHYDQLTFPEPPDTSSMIAQAKAQRSTWLDEVNAAYEVGQITTGGWLNARNDVEDWYGVETLRIDQLYCEYYGVR